MLPAPERNLEQYQQALISAARYISSWYQVTFCYAAMDQLFDLV